MTHEHDHESMMSEIEAAFGPVLDESPDGVYLWLDESHKVCNENLAAMFGYTVDEWCAAEPFLDTFVAPEDRGVYSWNYQNRVAALAYPVTFRFRALHRDGSTFAAETDMIPVAWQGHPVAYHFVRRVGD
jgi:PAS domain S-box-containing protein